MRDPSRILQVLNDRGRRGLGVNKIYKHLCSPELALAAWAAIYDNDGALTAGVDPADTAEGMSMEVIEDVCALLRSGRYFPKAVRRTHIPKKNGKLRPLGLPGFRDKLVSQMVRMLLEAYFEPQFSEASYAYRPGRSVADTIGDINDWKGVTWWIEGDIADCFGSIDHDVMIAILAERIEDERLLALIGRFLKAGYMEDGAWHATDTGAPQGGVLSPILSNIYLHRLDQFVEQELLPRYNRGAVRANNPEYNRLTHRIGKARRVGDMGAARVLERQRRTIPSIDTEDPGFRRLRYARFADDHLLGFTGPKAEAEQIKQRLAAFLADELKLTLSQEKTFVTHARTSPARFLGFELITRHDKGGSRRRLNGLISPRVPADVIRAGVRRYRRGGKAAIRTDLVNRADWEIIAIFQSELRGLTQFYRTAVNQYRLHAVASAMKHSMLRTLAAKYRSSTVKMHDRFGAHATVGNREYRCYQASYRRGDGSEGTARFGPIKLTWQRRRPVDKPPWRPSLPDKEVVRRLRRGACEVCERRTPVSVHQIKHLTDLNRWDPKLTWVKAMKRLRRLTLFVCGDCHDYVHASIIV